MKQDVSINWVNYTNDHRVEGKLDFEFWGGDMLSSLIVRYMLNELLMPESLQKQMRKTLSFLDLGEYDLSHFYEMIEEILFSDALEAERKPLKILRCVHLCLNLLYHWSAEAGNLKHAVFAAERVILRLWEWIHQREVDKNIWEIFYTIDNTRRQINNDYLSKIIPHCLVRDGLGGYGSEEVEYPLLIFEQIGIISSIGLDYIYSGDALNLESPNNYLQRLAQKAAYALKGIIQNNEVSRVPVYDSHINDITMALILLYRTNHVHMMKKWIHQLFLYIGRNYQLRDRFPLLNDSYDDLIEIELGLQNVELSSSTLLPMLLEWTLILDWAEQYDQTRELIQNLFETVDLQIWFPDDFTEKYMYRTNALFESGSMLTTIQLPETFGQFRTMFYEEIRRESGEDGISFIVEHFPIIGVLSFRHFRTPVFPSYWRKLVNPSHQ